MKKIRLLVIAGVFNAEGGGPSPFADTFIERSRKHFDLQAFNGGDPALLDEAVSLCGSFRAILWLAHVKDGGYLSRIKEVNKDCLLIQARRNDRKRNSLCEIILDMDKNGTDLCLIIDHDREKYDFKLLDTVANLWYEGPDTSEVITRLQWYIDHVAELKRIKSAPSDFTPSKITIDEDYYQIVRLFGAILKNVYKTAKSSECIMDSGALRSMHGYPSVRTDDAVLVSCRNIDARGITKDDFVPVETRTDVVSYSGNREPAIDTAVHLQLYKYYQNVKYIIHTHCCVEHAPMTSIYVPCGCIEDVDEINKIYPNRNSCDFAINLLGHGCIILAENLGYFTQCRLVAKHFPEKMKKDHLDYMRNWKDAGSAQDSFAYY